MKISMLSALSVWGKSTRSVGSRASAITAISSQSRCFAHGLPSLKARGDRVSIWLRHVRRIHPFLSRSRRIMKPSRPFLKHASAFLLNGPTRLHLLLLGRWKVPPQCAPLVMKKLMRSYSRWLLEQFDRFHLDWPQEQETSKRSKLDDRYLSGGQGEGPQRRSLPFFGDLHDEVARSWNRPYSSRVFVPSTSIYSTIVDAKARGYMVMPQIEETLAGYLSPGSSSSLKKATLPTKPCRVTSSLVGKAFQAAGQAGAALHTMAVLQAYQADLLKDVSTGGSIDEEAFLELRRATDLSLRATKQMARAIGRSMAAMVSTERHLWLNLTGIKDKDRTFLLDAPISPSGLFGDAVNTVATRFREAKRYEEAFVRFLPRHAQESGTSATRSRPGLVPLRRDAQKESVASRAPPRRDWGAARRASQSASKRPDLRSIISSKKRS